MESDRSCAAVYGPDSLQEKWLGFFPSFLFSWVFVFPSQIRTALLHACLVQSTEHSTAGPNWPLSARKWERAGKHLGRHVPPPPELTGRALPRAAGAEHRASIVQEVPGKHWCQSMSSMSPSLLPLQQLSSPVPLALPHLPGISASTETEHPQSASTFRCVSWSPQEAAALSLQAPGH